MAGGVFTSIMQHLMAGEPVKAAGVGLAASTQLLGTRQMAKAITSPGFARWLAEGTKIPATQYGDYVGRLAGIAASTKDPEQKAAIEDIQAKLAADLQSGGQ
jgi:hypothetical protein